MRAAVISKFNEPWELRDMPDPRPAPGQVLIHVNEARERLESGKVRYRAVIRHAV